MQTLQLDMTTNQKSSQVSIPRILVVDDEKDIAYSIEFALKQEGYQTVPCHDGHEALNLALEEQFDLIILDVLLPGISGFDICKEIRNKGIKVPILMLTAKTTEIDAVIGLELGADDYIPKPARMKELIARVRTRLRNSPLNATPDSKSSSDQEPEQIELGPLSINLISHTVYLQGNEIELTQREFELLKTLAINPNRVYSRNQLLEQVWGWSFIGESRTVDVHIRYLREKLEKDPANPEMIRTVRGIGYKLVPLSA
ncbi:MAG: response regulator transcription factor [Candidatus Caenarcaniphilales bacterium]|nr:response regulator transcription factor [Candidatus Caenarcaniphilales bacterium]